MNTLRYCLILLISMGFTHSCFALSRFWIASGSSNWNNTANWSGTSGGAGGVSVPAIGDDVNFDNGGLGACNIDAVVSVKSFTIAAGYTGTISQGANSITTSNAGSFSGGTFSGGSANITIGGAFTLAGTAFTSTSAVLELDNATVAFTSAGFAHNNGTVRLKSAVTQTLSGISPTFSTLEFVGIAGTYVLSSVGNITVLSSLNTSGSVFFNINTGVIDVKGNINSANTATGCGGDALININGTVAQTFTGSATIGGGALPQLTINKASGTLSLVNFPGVSNNFTYTTGTVSPGTSTFCFTHGTVASYNITGSLSFANIAFPVNTSLITITIGSTTILTATGDLSISGAANMILNTGTINVNGNINLTNTGNSGGGSATINIVGAGAENLDGSAIAINQSRLPMININKPSGLLTLLGNISVANNVTNTSGLVDAGTSTCYVAANLTATGNMNLYNLIINATNTTVAAGTTVTVTNTLDLENGAGIININTGTIASQGNVIDNNTGTGGGGTGTILINGTGTQTITTTGIIDQGRFPGVTINKTAGTLILPSLITVKSDWTYTAGTVDVTTNNSTVVFENTMNITGTQTLKNIIFDAPSNYTFTTAVGTTVTVQGDISMIGTGNITLNTGTYNLAGNLALSNTGGGGGTSVIAFNGTTNQAITSALLINQNCLPSVTINKPSGTLSFPALITVRGNWVYTAGTLDVTTNNSTVVFGDPLGTGLFGISGTHTLNNVSFEATNNNTLTIATGTLLTVTGTLATLGTANMYINTTVTGATGIQAQGNISINNTGSLGGGSGLILINGTGAQAFSSSVAASKGQVPFIKIQKTSGTLAISGIITEGRDWNYTSGTVDATTAASTLVFGGGTNLSITSAGMSFYNVIFTANTSTLTNSLTANGNLTINGTGILAPGANTINLSGNWTSYGTAGFTEATSTVNLKGSALQTVAATGGENFTNLIINNSSTGIQLGSAVGVATALTMTQGNIDLNSKTLSLGTSAAVPGTLAYTAGTMFNTGFFTRWFATSTIAAGNVAGLFPTGTVANYRPFNVSISAAPTTGGTITVGYTNSITMTAVSFADGASTVVIRKDLNWNVSTATLAGGTYNLGISGTGYGLVGNVSDLRLTLANSVVGTAGTNAGTVSNPQVNRTGLTLANLTNTFYLGSINIVASPLPVKLLSFTATPENTDVKLDWETAAEFNNDHFTIQRSTNAKNWEDIQTVSGSQNTNTDSKYTAYDQHPHTGISYYRLEQTDIDGKFSYSMIRSVDLDATILISLYPNPATDQLFISSGAGILHISLFGSNGRKINIVAAGSANNISMNIGNLAAGVYFIEITTADKREITKIFTKR